MNLKETPGYLVRNGLRWDESQGGTPLPVEFSKGNEAFRSVLKKADEGERSLEPSVLPAFGFFVPKTVRSRFLPRLGKPDIGWSLHETDPDETRHWGLIGHRDWVRFCSDLFRHFQGSINGASEKRPFWFSFAFSWSPARVLSFGTPGRCQAMPDRSIVMLTSTE